MNAKQKIVLGRGPSNINYGTFVCSFDVGRISHPFPSFNYGLTVETTRAFLTENCIMG